MQNRNIAIKILIILVCIAFSNTGASAEPPQDATYVQDVKAVFIYNFTKYMNWAGEDTLFQIGVIGETPILDPLRQIAQKRRVNQKEIQIKHFDHPDQIDHCHILFIPESEKSQLNAVIRRIRDKNILTVSEIENALFGGVMINFVIRQETVKFEINLQAIKQAGFQPGSELLKLAVRLVE